MAAVSGRAAVSPADIVVRNARIYTANAKQEMADAMAIQARRLVFVGSDLDAKPWIGPDTQVIDAHGRLILPGLIDSHIHPDDILELPICDLKNVAKSLKEVSAFVRECIKRYAVPPGEWVNVFQWNVGSGNAPDTAHPTLRATLDLASRDHPIQLMANDGHRAAYNSVALSRAKNSAGQAVGFSKRTLAEDFKQYGKLVAVDASGEPNGIIIDEAQYVMSPPYGLDINFAETMKAPERITARLNSAGITGILDAWAQPKHLVMYDAIEKSGNMTVRANLAQYYNPDGIKTSGGKPDWDHMLESATRIRAKYSHDPLIRADFIKIMADAVQEGDPHALPPTLPPIGALRPYLQPIFRHEPQGRVSVRGYVDTEGVVCTAYRSNPERYQSTNDSAAFLKVNGFYPQQCVISSGQLTSDRAVIMEETRRFHAAGFNIHFHTIGELAIKTAVDAIEAARASDGVSTTHDALAHVQVTSPDDVPRIGKDHLYLAFTFSWISIDPEYDLSVVPFFDHVSGRSYEALHPMDGYYEKRAYVVKDLANAGAVILGGSDAPVNTRDPQPFVNIASAVTRKIPAYPALTPAQSLSIRDAIDAYSINGARYLFRDTEAGSLEVGKSADFVVLDRDILALADSGRAAEIGSTGVLETWFMGKRVYARHP